MANREDKPDHMPFTDWARQMPHYVASDYLHALHNYFLAHGDSAAAQMAVEMSMVCYSRGARDQPRT